MADAKSRYEIVNELVDKKIGLLEEISTLNGNNALLDGQLEQLVRNQARQLEDTTAANKLTQKNNEKRAEELKEKTAAIDEAIKAIKAISVNKKEAST